MLFDERYPAANVILNEVKDLKRYYAEVRDSSLRQVRLGYAQNDVSGKTGYQLKDV